MTVLIRVLVLGPVGPVGQGDGWVAGLLTQGGIRVSDASLLGCPGRRREREGPGGLVAVVFFTVVAGILVVSLVVSLRGSGEYIGCGWFLVLWAGRSTKESGGHLEAIDSHVRIPWWHTKTFLEPNNSIILTITNVTLHASWIGLQ